MLWERKERRRECRAFLGRFSPHLAGAGDGLEELELDSLQRPCRVCHVKEMTQTLSNPPACHLSGVRACNGHVECAVQFPCISITCEAAARQFALEQRSPCPAPELRKVRLHRLIIASTRADKLIWGFGGARTVKMSTLSAAQVAVAEVNASCMPHNPR